MIQDRVIERRLFLAGARPASHEPLCGTRDLERGHRGSAFLFSPLTLARTVFGESRTCWQDDRAALMVCPLESYRGSIPYGVFSV
jgi:hypothetical protein